MCCSGTHIYTHPRILFFKSTRCVAVSCNVLQIVAMEHIYMMHTPEFCSSNSSRCFTRTPASTCSTWKQDLHTWKKTPKRDNNLWKETQKIYPCIWKFIYVKRDLYMWICESTPTSICSTCEEDLYTWKETQKRDRFIGELTQKYLHMWKETQKRD